MEKIRPFKQKTIGILGGMSDKATAEYYRLINLAVNEKLGEWDNAEIIIASVNFGNIEHFVRNAKWDDAKEYLSEKIDRLERAGVDVIGCVSNTMHSVVGPIMETRKTPFIHIADPAGKAASGMGIKKAAMFGTMPVMKSEPLKKRYKDLFGIEIVVPSDEDKTEIDRVIFDEIVRETVKEDSKKRFISIAEGLRKEGAQGLVLGCTEIFLLINQKDFSDFPVFDTTELHARALAEFALG